MDVNRTQAAASLMAISLVPLLSLLTAQQFYSFLLKIHLK
jgi:hypothetical protein